jgi:TRAP transporter TAXI family solute receptor
MPRRVGAEAERARAERARSALIGRRQMVAGLVGTAGLTLAGCNLGTKSSAAPHRWHDGRLFVATGNTTGVFYQLGGGYADLVGRYVEGYEARAEPTGASGENIQRLADGDMDIAFTTGDTAADAATGRGAYVGKAKPIQALARMYRNYMQVVARTEAKIQTVADMRGKRISTSSLNSGTDFFAGRILEAAGLDPDRDITRQRLSLPDTTKGMQEGNIDALFFSGGLPTPGIADLFASAPGKFSFVPLDKLGPPLSAKYGPIYATDTVAKETYNQPDAVQLVVPTLVIVNANMPDELAYQLTKVLFDHQPELKKVHPEGGHFDRAGGPNTQPVPLHPGAVRYYSGMA